MLVIIFGVFVNVIGLFLLFIMILVVERYIDCFLLLWMVIFLVERVVIWYVVFDVVIMILLFWLLFFELIIVCVLVGGFDVNLYLVKCGMFGSSFNLFIWICSVWIFCELLMSVIVLWVIIKRIWCVSLLSWLSIIFLWGFELICLLVECWELWVLVRNFDVDWKWVWCVCCFYFGYMIFLWVGVLYFLVYWLY